MTGTPTQVVTRIAPSPTGLFHIGTARTALFNYLYAKKYGGKFLVRIEDTDTVRSKPEYEEDILQGLAWLGTSHDGAIVRQSDRAQEGVYTALLERLIASDKAYVSSEPAKDDPSKTVEVVRLRNPGRVLTFRDEVRGDISFDTTELKDFVIARSRTDPLYHFAVVVDDAESGVTHVIRGEDHISNTPRQILIQEALGYPRPIYAHLPLILAPDRSKMSKRKGATSMVEYRAQGFLPQAIVNYLALLGWNPGTEQEVFTIDELIQLFSLEGIQKGGAVFDIEKLKWLNRQHRAKIPAQEQHALFLSHLDEHPNLCAVLARCPLALDDVLERFTTSGEFLDAVRAGEFDFYHTRPQVTRAQLVFKKDPLPEHLQERLVRVRDLLDTVDEGHFTALKVKTIVWDYAEQEGRGNVLWPLRYALSGRDKSPDPFLIAEALGKDETITRLDTAIATAS
jgi:glutamyl-tRNA synthetase